MTDQVQTPRRDRFGYGPTISGYEVIDLVTGRPVGAREYESARAANGAAFRLNNALAAGPKALAQALGATDRPLPIQAVGRR